MKERMRDGRGGGRFHLCGVQEWRSFFSLQRELMRHDVISNGLSSTVALALVCGRAPSAV